MHAHSDHRYSEIQYWNFAAGFNNAATPNADTGAQHGGTGDC